MRKQLLWLMYKESLDRNNRKQVNRVLRSNEIYIFKVENKIGTTYQRSPYYIGTLLWNELPVDTQKMNDIVRFKQLIGMRYCTYEEVL